MKCTITRDDVRILDVSRLTTEQAARVKWKTRGTKLVPYWAVGETLEDPEAHILVVCGLAVPADEECRKRAGLSPEEMARVQVSANRVAAGIHPDDFSIFDAGFISGYNADGSYKPGPKWDEYQQLVSEQAEQSVPLAEDNTL